MPRNLIAGCTPLPGMAPGTYYEKRNGTTCYWRNLQMRYLFTRKPRLDRDKFGIYYLNGERVFISFEWQVRGKVRFGSKKVRTVAFTVSAKDRGMAVYAMHRRIKGGAVVECLSLTPCDFWKGCFYTMREGHPEIPRSILTKLSLPTTL